MRPRRVFAGLLPNSSWISEGGCAVGCLSFSSFVTTPPDSQASRLHARMAPLTSTFFCCSFRAQPPPSPPPRDSLYPTQTRLAPSSRRRCIFPDRPHTPAGNQLPHALPPP
ncbi:hypothetical protein B0H16DRAFT_1885139 [Mycena metata]|uniref:Uncharacterized protein n=1 Tax=Mycena metata TaxID=1033252 RepID=A0AAD7JBQ2_9AGAR|nr:hypothetical protein B0H16DRAFT_1885139 [Mycena metata]